MLAFRKNEKITFIQKLAICYKNECKFMKLEKRFIETINKYIYTNILS